MKVEVKVILFILVLFFSSCKKLVNEVNVNYFGDWVNHPNWIDTRYSLSIYENNHATFRKKGLMEDNACSGDARVGNGVLTIGRIRRFTIKQEPQRFNSIYGGVTYTWSMELYIPELFGGEKVTLYKQ